MSQLPILWSFRRCPYAMRARLAVQSAGLRVELREILLRDKPPAFLQASRSATVPTLELSDRVIDESLDIMIWALTERDSDGLLTMPKDAWRLIEETDGPFKAALDHTKYAIRYPDLNPADEREKAAQHIRALDEMLAGRSWLYGDHATLADFAILPFVRQFANIDRAWFEEQPWPHAIRWLDAFLESAAFGRIMLKRAIWSEGDAPQWFGDAI